MTPQKFNQECYDLIASFVQKYNDLECPLENSLRATVAQFIWGFHDDLKNRELNGLVSLADIIEAQLTCLRRCVVHLEHCKKIGNTKETMQ